MTSSACSIGESSPGLSPVDLARIIMQPKFKLGRCVATPGAVSALSRNRQNHSYLLMMHEQALWIHMDDAGVARNFQAIDSGGVVHGVFNLRDGQALWVVTDADRSTTTILLPEEH
jgi:hypothetical protein